MSIIDKVVAAVTPPESAEARQAARQKALSAAGDGDWRLAGDRVGSPYTDRNSVRRSEGSRGCNYTAGRPEAARNPALQCARRRNV
jgi:hypothetical protein